MQSYYMPTYVSAYNKKPALWIGLHTVIVLSKFADSFVSFRWGHGTVSNSHIMIGTPYHFRFWYYQVARVSICLSSAISFVSQIMRACQLWFSWKCISFVVWYKMARRMMSRLGQWSSSVFAVDFDTNSDPIYFALASKQSERPQVFRNVLADEMCYSLHVQSDDKIERAKFYGGLKKKLSKELPPECTILEMSIFQPNVKDSVIKGYFLKDASKSSATERVLGQLLRNDPVYVCSYLCGGEDRQWSQHLWSNTEDGWVEVLEKYCVVPAEKPVHHPSTLNIINYDVFYSFEDAYKVLQQVWIVTLLCVKSVDTCCRVFVQLSLCI